MWHLASARRTLILLTLPLSVPAFPYDVSTAAVAEFIIEMSAEHGFDESYLADVLLQAQHQQRIIDAISRPAEKTKPWHEYRAIFMTPSRIEGGVQFWEENNDSLEYAAERFGVPPQIIIAILGVETKYGKITGGYRVIDALSTLAFDYPPRSRFFRAELEQFLLLTREEEVAPLEASGSYAGAMGAAQFISSSYRAYAVDINGDGRRDLWNDWADIIGSVANYFRSHGWRPGETVVTRAELTSAAAHRMVSDRLRLNHTAGQLRQAGVQFDADVPHGAKAMLMRLDGERGPEYWIGFHNFYVITRYNRSVLYAMAVSQLSEEIVINAFN